MSTEILLVDLSSIVHPIFHMSASEPDPNHCSQATVARVHALANGAEHVAICCDSGKSFRKELDSTYKANRPERNETLHHQIALAVETLKADGFPIWTADGFEADDVIAAATTRALALDDTTVLIVTGDKDLLVLKNYEHIPILTPRQFWSVLTQKRDLPQKPKRRIQLRFLARFAVY